MILGTCNRCNVHLSPAWNILGSFWVSMLNFGGYKHGYYITWVDIVSPQLREWIYISTSSVACIYIYTYYMNQHLNNVIASWGWDTWTRSFPCFTSQIDVSGSTTVATAFGDLGSSLEEKRLTTSTFTPPGKTKWWNQMVKPNGLEPL